MKVTHIVGARPQFIKASSLIRQLPGRLVHTGQHYDKEMSDIFFLELDIPGPDCALRSGSGTHSQQIARMLIGLEKELIFNPPDLVIVYGDTNTTLAGALAASYLNIKIAHVEAGCRSFNNEMVEETNRKVTDHLSTYLFCPTETAIRNLREEGIKGHLVGDIMIDSLKTFGQLADNSYLFDLLKIKPKEYLLLTIHRPINADNPSHLNDIMEALNKTDQTVIFPIHPRTRKHLKTFPKNVKVIKPVSYLDFLALEKNASKILTDSGGIQKEAYFFKVPCITLREETEWPETIGAGWNVLVSSDKDKIIEAIRNFEPTKEPIPLFGDGKAAKRISEILLAR